MSTIENVPAAEWAEWADSNNAVILDVREPEEWELGTLPGSTLISLGDIMEKSGELDPDRPILCVCRSGGRSGQVATYLESIGFETVANMSGGVKALGMQD